MPSTRASEPIIGVDSSRSSALPAGTPSRISVSTTSAKPRSMMRCAVVEPTNPPPTTVTFLRMQSSLLEVRFPQWRPSGIRKGSRVLRYGELGGSDAGLHVLDDGRSKLGSAQFLGSFHEPLEIVGYALLPDGALDSFFDQPGRLAPAHEVKHHGAGEHDRTRIDDVLIGVFRGRA